MIRAVIGLGNPGSTYASTRHNMGFMVVDQLARMLGVGVTRRQCQALTGEARRRGNLLLLAKPETYMNLSGQAVVALLDRFRFFPEEMLVISDDMDLPFGRLRLKARGGSGGHRGLESIIINLGTDRFPRLRLGIGRSGEAVEHVLGGFSEEERAAMDELIKTAASAVLTAVDAGLERAMNQYNAWTLSSDASR